jgi:hypothetical protein
MESIFGRPAAQQAQMVFPQIKLAAIRRFDKLMYSLEAARKRLGAPSMISGNAL